MLQSCLPIAAFSAALNDDPRSCTCTVPLASIGIAAALFAAGVVMFERQEL